jgi:hypothetical protein
MADATKASRKTLTLNRQGAPANPPQHSADDYGATGGPKPSRDGLSTGVGTSDADVSDPHPSDEEHPYRERRPGGTNPLEGTTQRVNSHTHTGKAPPRPKNAENT